MLILVCLILKMLNIQLWQEKMVSPGLSNSFYGMHIWFLETGLVRDCLLFMAGDGDFGFPTTKKVPPSLPAKIKCPLKNIFCRKYFIVLFLPETRKKWVFAGVLKKNVPKKCPHRQRAKNMWPPSVTCQKSGSPQNLCHPLHK